MGQLSQNRIAFFFEEINVELKISLDTYVLIGTYIFTKHLKNRHLHQIKKIINPWKYNQFLSGT
jgi:hypothetical protein